MKSILKKSIPHVIAIAIFLILVCVYFSPSVFDGKVIQQGDTIQASGVAEEIHSYWEKEKGKSAWTGSIFSGMPTYHIYVHGNPPNFLGYLQNIVYKLDYFGGSMVFVALICFYLLMCAMGVKRWLAIAGSVAFAFASFNLISIMAGHVTKVYVMAYMPLPLAGMVLLFKPKWVWGSVLLAIGICFSIMNSHLQITYYLAILCVILALGFLFVELRKKEYSRLAKTFGVMAICVVLAVLPNMGSLYANYELGQESTRGPSELTTVSAEAGTGNSDGLNIDYAFMWSYGKGELLTLLIPNAYGGESGGMLSQKSDFYKAYKSLGGQVRADGVQAPTYWGDQLFTSGPVYFGAIVCFLFLLGMFVIKHPLKWWLTGAALFFIFLSLGRNMSGLNDFLFYHLPMYNKFRTPSMALVIPGMIFPIVGFWGLKEIVSGKIASDILKKSLFWSTGIVGGICLLIWVIPDVFLSFRSATDAQFQWPAPLIDALISSRKSLASADALRSLIFVLLGAALLFYFLYAKNKKQAATIIGIGMLILITIDLWSVDKRYLNDENFKKQKITETFKKTVADEFILQDKSPSYRVLNVTTSTFQDAGTSFFHKSIGGYHAAKLGRYQELIDHRLQKEIDLIRSGFGSATSLDDLNDVFQNTPGLNMLNAKYIIFSPEHPPLINTYANGNAWFVNQVRLAENADQELSSLNTINPLETVVVDKRFESMTAKPDPDSENSGTIELISYKPNMLIYESNASKDQVAVFSEIYYPHGWKAFIDGKPADHYRADWTLRAMNVPAGKHTIEFRFEPDKYNNLMKLGSLFSLLLLCLFVGAVVYSFFKIRKDQQSPGNGNAL